MFSLLYNLLEEKKDEQRNLEKKKGTSFGPSVLYYRQTYLLSFNLNSRVGHSHRAETLCRIDGIKMLWVSWEEVKPQHLGAWVTAGWKDIAGMELSWLSPRWGGSRVRARSSPAHFLHVELLQCQLTLHRIVSVIKLFPQTSQLRDDWEGPGLLAGHESAAIISFLCFLLLSCSSFLPVTCNSMPDWWFVCGTLREL